jgi:hypothetical protein
MNPCYAVSSTNQDPVVQWVNLPTQLHCWVLVRDRPWSLLWYKFTEDGAAGAWTDQRGACTASSLICFISQDGYLRHFSISILFFWSCVSFGFIWFLCVCGIAFLWLTLVREAAAAALSLSRHSLYSEVFFSLLQKAPLAVNIDASPPTQSLSPSPIQFVCST